MNWAWVVLGMFTSVLPSKAITSGQHHARSAELAAACAESPLNPEHAAYTRHPSGAQ